MLSKRVQEDYQNDWIYRCEKSENINFKVLASRGVVIKAGKDSDFITDPLIKILNDKKVKVREDIKKKKEVLILFDLRNSQIDKKTVSLLDGSNYRKIVVTDRRSKSLKYAEKAEVLFLGTLCGAGIKRSPDCGRNCSTNALDMFAALLYMASSEKTFKPAVYYAGFGWSGANDIKMLKDDGYEPMITFEDSVFMLEFSRRNKDKLFYFDDAYNGELELLHELLYKCLAEFDRLCQKFHINYFLGGGSLLGAVRHGSIIPWDDDIDVMMTREEYNKFLKVVKTELNGKEFFFQSSDTDEEYHSVFTKIRLNGTKFITTYSSQFEKMHQGIFIDIFVHDKTSNNKLMQKWHVFKTLLARSMVFHKWEGTPLHYYGSMKTICRWATKYMNKKDMAYLEDKQHKVITKYDKKNTSMLYDGTGEHLRHGAFEARLFEDAIYKKFGDREYPVPQGYREYLRYSYGDYEKMLPASERKVGHDIIRIDFGKYKSDK